MTKAIQSTVDAPMTGEVTNRSLVQHLRAHFPVFGEFKPLKIGIHGDLIALNLGPENKVRNALAKHTRDNRYLRKMVAGATRFDLGGEACGEVLPEQQAQAVIRLADKSTAWSKVDAVAASKTQPIVIQELDMRANTMKVTTVITDFAKHLQVNSMGVKTVPIAVLIDRVTVRAELNAKSFRKAQSMFSELAGEAAVVVSGEYDFARATIKSAGIVVQPKKPKTVVSSGEQIDPSGK